MASFASSATTGGARSTPGPMTNDTSWWHQGSPCEEKQGGWKKEEKKKEKPVWQNINTKDVLGSTWFVQTVQKVSFLNQFPLFLNKSYSWIEIRLHNKTHHPRYTGSGWKEKERKMCVIDGTFKSTGPITFKILSYLGQSPPCTLQSLKSALFTAEARLWLSVPDRCTIHVRIR